MSLTNADLSKRNSGLSPIEEHYLKKELLKIEINSEFSRLSPEYNDISGLRRFGPPFLPFDPKLLKEGISLDDIYQISNDSIDEFTKEFPILRFVLENFIITFPFIKLHLLRLGSTWKDQHSFWVKIQLLFELWKSKKISNSNDRGSTSKRQLALYKIRAIILMLFNSAIYCEQDPDYFANDKQNRGAFKKLGKLMDNAEQERLNKDVDLEIEEIASLMSIDPNDIDDSEYINGWYVNVSGVTSEIELKKNQFWGSKESKYYNFIIRVKGKNDSEDWYVQRRYSEFKLLHKELQSLYPNVKFPHLPAKDKHHASMNVDVGSNEAINEDLTSPELSFHSLDDDEISMDQFITIDDSNSEEVNFNPPKTPNSNSFSSSTKSIFSKGPKILTPNIFMSPKASNDKNHSSSKSIQSPIFNVGKLEKSFLNSMKLTSDEVDKKLHPSLPRDKKNDVDDSIFPSISSKSQQNSDSVSLPRESLRVSLRNYLFNILNKVEISKSPELIAFLSNNPIILTKDQEVDIKNRTKIDHLITIQHIKFQKELVNVVTDLESEVLKVKKELYDKGFSYIFDEIRNNETMETLSGPIKGLIKVIELEIASTQYEVLVGSDSAHETLKVLKHFHKLMPYKMMATILRFTNPLQMVKKMVDLFTYQMPLGWGNKGRSLLQVIFTGLLGDDVKHLDHKLQDIKKKMKNSAGMNFIFQRIDKYFESDDDNVLKVKEIAKQTGLELPLAILLPNNGLSNVADLPIEILLQILTEYKIGLRKENSGYNLTLTYFQTKLRKWDKEAMVDLWNEPELTEVIKEILSIFFQPLIELFKRAEVYKYVPIFAKYLTELCYLCTKYTKDFGLFNRGDIVSSFVNLEGKYAVYVYQFMREMYLNDLKLEPDRRLFDGVINWLNGFVNFLRFVKSDHPELRINCEELLENSNIPVESKNKIFKEIEEIVLNVEKKRKLYLEVKEGKLNNSAPDVQDFFKLGRNKKIDQNWDKVNGKVFKIGELVVGDGSEGGISGIVGIDEADLEDLDIDMDLTDDEEESSIQFRNFESAEIFLKEYLAFSSSALNGKAQPDGVDGLLLESFQAKLIGVLTAFV